MPSQELDMCDCGHTKSKQHGVLGCAICICTKKYHVLLNDKQDAVNHPTHYGGEDNPYEHVKVAKAWRLGAMLYQCTKYICRAGKKDPTKYVEELQKAMWFLQQEINTQYDLMLKGGKP